MMKKIRILKLGESGTLIVGDYTFNNKCKIEYIDISKIDPKELLRLLEQKYIEFTE